MAMVEGHALLGCKVLSRGGRLGSRQAYLRQALDKGLGVDDAGDGRKGGKCRAGWRPCARGSC